MTPISVIELLPSTENQIDTFAHSIKTSILDGDFDYRKYLYQKKMMEKTFELLENDFEFKEFLQKEIEKFGKDGVSFNDLKFELQDRKTWDYSMTGDSELENLIEQKKKIDEAVKARQKLLQTTKKPFADIDTGEIIHPASYSSKTFIKSSTKK